MHVIVNSINLYHNDDIRYINVQNSLFESEIPL